jgi:hypothetical protein
VEDVVGSDEFRYNGKILLVDNLFIEAADGSLVL